MTKPQDPQRGTPAERSLRATFRAQEIAREARLDQLEARLTEHARRIDSLLAAEREQAREQVTAEVVSDRPDTDEHAPPIEGHVPPPAPAEDLDMLAAQSLTGSELHQRWRSQHVNNDRGIFT